MPPRFETLTDNLGSSESIRTREYQRLFEKRHSHLLRLLHLSAKDSSELLQWKNLLPNANIMGSGIYLAYNDYRNLSSLDYFVGIPHSPTVHQKILNKSQAFDIIIDSSAHTSWDIVSNFNLFFENLSNGSQYILEDLNTYYLTASRAGLFNLYSPVTFFHKLADICSLSAPARKRLGAEYLAQFSKHSPSIVNTEILDSIQSIEFTDSLCVIIKNGGADIESVPQSTDENTLIKTPRNEVFEASLLHYISLARDLEGQVNELKIENDTLINSTSWKITAPLRNFVTHVKRYNSALRLAGRLYKQRKLLPLLSKSWQIWLREGRNGVLERLKDDGYSRWIQKYDQLTVENRSQINLGIETLVYRPLISVLMPVYNPPPEYLEQAIQSVINQIYPFWELCIADDASTDPEIKKILQRYQEQEARIRVLYRTENGHISKASNSALELASGEFVALMDHDDILPEHALFSVANEINCHPDAELIYSDEDKIDAQGNRYGHYFKCDFNYELLLAQNMISHLGVYRRKTMEKVGGFRIGLEGSQDYDLALRFVEHIDDNQIIHIPKILYHWRAIEGSTALAPGEKDYASDAMRKALQEHLERRGKKAEVLPAPGIPNFNRVVFHRPEPKPLVSIIIPTRDRAKLLSLCIDSILQRSTYENFELIIIDNDSQESATFHLFERLPKEKIRIIQDKSPFNYSSLNNLAAKQANGELLCLMNNDIEIITPDWLEEMASFAIQPEIGAVGARLWYPNQRLQHGGVIVGLGGVAGHSHKNLPKGHPGYWGRGALHQAFSAVTAACLLVRREIYEMTAGMDESLAVAFNDVDFCLRIQAAGYRNVWTPYAEMIHHESATRGLDISAAQRERFQSEIQFMQMRWGTVNYHDFAYSPNLTKQAEDFSLSWQ